MKKKQSYDNFRQQNDQLQLDRLRLRVQEVQAKPTPAIVFPHFDYIDSYQSEEDNQILQLGYQYKLLFYQNLLKKLLSEKTYLNQYIGFYSDASSKFAKNILTQFRPRLELLETKVELTETIIGFLDHAANDFLSFNEEYRVYCLEDQLRLLLDDVERAIIAGKIGSGDFIPFIVLFYETARNEDFKLCKHLIKQLAARIRTFLKTDIRQRYRNVLRLHFKNMDDNSGADNLFLFILKQIIESLNYYTNDQFTEGFNYKNQSCT